MIENWCTVQAPALAAAEPIFPDGIADRDADCWEAPLAIADAAGDAWSDLREVFGGEREVGKLNYSRPPSRPARVSLE